MSNHNKIAEYVDNLITKRLIVAGTEFIIASSYVNKYGFKIYTVETPVDFIKNTAIEIFQNINLGGSKREVVWVDTEHIKEGIVKKGSYIHLWVK